jgi:retron-type reverse transcriptase
VIAIPKADKTKLCSVEGYRDISLLSVPGKCLEKLVIERLKYFLETTGQISSLQFGFTAGRSTADAIKTVSDFVGHNRKRGLKCCVLALDITEAFDNAWLPKFLARLRKLKCPPNTYNMVKDFLCDRTAHVTLGISLSSKQLIKGSPQGSVSEPTLWNIIISDLTTLISNKANVKIVVLADDIVIMKQEPSLPESLKECKPHSKP